MPFFPETYENLARNGVTLDLSNVDNLFPQTLMNVVRIAVANEGNVIINASSLFPKTLEELALIGKQHITFKF